MAVTDAVHREIQVFKPSGRNSGDGVLRGAIRDIIRARGTAWQLMSRDLAATYRQSFLGYIWVIVPSVALACSFQLAGSAKILNTESTVVPYTLFALVGVVLWQSFAEAINGPLTSIRQARKTLTRVAIAPEAILMARIGTNLVNLTVRLCAVGFMMWWYDSAVTWASLLAIPSIGLLICLGTAIGLFLAPISGLYDDVSMVMGMVLSVWFMLTPIMYQRAAEGSVIGLINQVNPVTPLLAVSRGCLIGEGSNVTLAFWVVSAASVLLFLVGLLVLKASLAFVVERQGA